MSERKRRFNLLTPIKNKITQKRRNTDRKTAPHSNADESQDSTNFVYPSVSREIPELSKNNSTNSDSDIIKDFTSTLNQAININSLQISPISHQSIDLASSSTCRPTNTDNMDFQEFASFFSRALKEEAVCQGLRMAMKPLIDPLEKKLDDAIKRIDNMEIAIDETNSKINNIEQKIDDLEQYSRKNNVRIVGIRENTSTATTTENTPSLIVDFINDTMKLDINSYDIGNAHRLGTRRTGADCRDIIVQFSANTTKQYIMKNRKKLRDTNRNIYINDDLTHRRALLFKDARKELKNNKLNAVWTRDGNIFAKLHEHSKPIKIDNNQGLARLITI